MNSHLVENYLTNPTATLPCVPLNPQFVERAELKSYCIGRSSAANVFGPNGKASPVSPPVANEVRSKLKEVKSRLIGDLAADLGVNPP